ncbi:MAG: hypothetical protein IT442_10435 [Phycisphaeraceae bacterium]|nr:hypothetical protein [Phycisphaeraceae bacterium]
MLDENPSIDDSAVALLDGLSPRQEQAILELLNQPTVARAAAAAGTSERSLYRWLSEPVFGAAYRRARRDAFSQAIAMTQRIAPLAVNTLATIMADTTAPHHARVTAATTILRFGREGIELDDFATRLASLEQTVDLANRGSR